jgi:integrase/recombinase XerD
MGSPAKRTKPRRKVRALTFPYAMRSFVGYLEGTRKAEHTIKNYRLDLLAFEKFLARAPGGKRPLPLTSVGHRELDLYHAHLRSEGFKTNTRRRKLMTVRKFMGYLAGRKKVGADLGRQLRAPAKVERVPLTVAMEELVAAIRAFPAATELEARDRALLWILAETGCLVSEAARLRAEDCDLASAEVRIPGKRARQLRVSRELCSAVEALVKHRRPDPRRPGWLFMGYNRFGPMGSGAITPRGIELLVRSKAARLAQPELTPRIIRHSVVLGWFRQGVEREEIQRRLGLRTPYAFRVFEPLFAAGPPLRSSSRTTSSAGSSPKGA